MAVRLSALRTGRPLPPGRFLVLFDAMFLKKYNFYFLFCMLVKPWNRDLVSGIGKKRDEIEEK
jgi:hypothetical protein